MTSIIQTPIDDYELLDFGNGRKLERFGAYVIDRPAPQAVEPPKNRDWQADWIFTGDRIAQGHWQVNKEGLPEEWSIEVDSQTMHLRLGEGGQVGIYPEHIACWRWIRERLEGCYHIEDLKALNLFAATGGATVAAVTAGATVTHVDASAAAIAQARLNVGETGARWIREDVMTYVERAVRRRETYDLIIADPPSYGRGPKGKSWDIQVDLYKLVQQLPHLISPDCRGVWLSFHTTEWSTQAVHKMLKDNLPRRSLHDIELGIATRDGRVLACGHSVCWEDDRDFLAANQAPASLTAAEIEEHLDPFLDPVLSSRRTAAEPARKLAECERSHQDFVLKWVEVIARSNNPELAFQFTSLASSAITLMDEKGMEAWILHTMDTYDRKGLHESIAVLSEVESFAETIKNKSRGIVFEDVSNVLELYAHGLSGRKLTLESADDAFTDTEKIFIPPILVRFKNTQENFELYKVMVTFLWAQCRFGTWRFDVREKLERYPDMDHALALFHALENIRLNACIARELPGIERLVNRLLEKTGDVLVPEHWQAYAKQLELPSATVIDSFRILSGIIEQPVPARVCFQGRLFPFRVEEVKAKRIQREKGLLQRALIRMTDSLEKTAQQKLENELDLKIVTKDEQALDFEIQLNERPMTPPDDVRALVTSIMLDLGEIPDEYLSAAGDGGYYLDDSEHEQEASRSVWSGSYHIKGAHLYNEWDFKRNHYRKQWCALRELDVTASDTDFMRETLRKYSGLVKNLRRTFEALRGEDKLLKKQVNGDDVDIDAFVEAHADVTTGMEMTDELFTKKHKVERNIAVMFMVDMSGSTKGWINDAERESLILLCEALETLGDRYAIYGFSGNTRNRCEVYRIKRFDEDYTEEVKGRICGIQPKDYTRMGVAIRHLTKLLNEVEARTKLLITLSDGKPDDLDGYRSEYGIEDTRMALIEAKQSGIHPFCITIDEEGNEYLPHLYGPVNYTVISEVTKLPLKVSDIYRRLTS